MRWLDKGDARSTSNLRKHVKRCWGDEVLGASDGLKAGLAREAVASYVRSGSITAAFKRLNKSGKKTYSARQHTKKEIQ